MTARAWFGLLRRHRFEVAPRRMPVAVAATLLSIRNSATGALQTGAVSWSRRRPSEAPLFVIGHWRSGTTWLHELLGADARHTCPTTYQCFSPGHFLLSEPAVRWLARFLSPIRRPMDAVPMDWDSPQEDEFALMNLGQPSPYQRFAFFDGPAARPGDLTLESLSPAARARWKRALRRFLTAVSIRKPGRLVLKSPLHTCRIPVLLEMFPDARFVHIVRDPFDVFPSTRHLWESMCEVHALGRSRLDRLDDFVFDTFLELHAEFVKAKVAIPPGHLAEVRYEDLIRDPLDVLRGIYEQLDLGPIEPALPALRERVASRAGYAPTRYTLPCTVRDAITRRWGAAIVQQGYTLPSSDGQSSCASS